MRYGFSIGWIQVCRARGMPQDIFATCRVSKFIQLDYKNLKQWNIIQTNLVFNTWKYKTKADSKIWDNKIYFKTNLAYNTLKYKTEADFEICEEKIVSYKPGIRMA